MKGKFISVPSISFVNVLSLPLPSLHYPMQVTWQPDRESSLMTTATFRRDDLTKILFYLIIYCIIFWYFCVRLVGIWKEKKNVWNSFKVRDFAEIVNGLSCLAFFELVTWTFVGDEFCLRIMWTSKFMFFFVHWREYWWTRSRSAFELEPKANVTVHETPKIHF